MPSSDDKIIPWSASLPASLPPHVDSPHEITKYAKQLKERDAQKVVSAFEAESYDMAAEFMYSRAMAFLKKQLSKLGMSFVGEMLNRPDITEDSSPEAISNYDAIHLAAELGMIPRAGALRLSQASELLAHFSDSDEPEELTKSEAVTTIRACVEYILSASKLDVSMDFAQFRSRLESEYIQPTDPIIESLLASPYFFIKTATRVLLSLVKIEIGAKLDNAVANMSSLLPPAWPKLADADRYDIGRAYVEVSAAGKSQASSGIKKLLMKVKGFDYVPENLRSNAYISAAKAVLDAHDSWHNYYDEPAPTKALAALGTSIPRPAFAVCMQAILSIKLGNPYGHCWDAQPSANTLLSRITNDDWSYYLNECLPKDERILRKLSNHDKPLSRWCELVNEYNLDKAQMSNSRVTKLVNAGAANQPNAAKIQAKALYAILEKGS